MDFFFSLIVAGIILFLCWSFGKSVEISVRRIFGLSDDER